MIVLPLRRRFSLLKACGPWRECGGYTHIDGLIHVTNTHRRKAMKVSHVSKHGLRFILAMALTGLAFPQSLPPLSPNASVYATGLNNPRGIKFGPDGALYVAEGGMGGTASTVGVCTQVVAPIGPYTGGNTGRISRIGLQGARSTVVDGLTFQPDQRGARLVGERRGRYCIRGLYHVCPHCGGRLLSRRAQYAQRRIQVNTDKGTWTPFANLSAFLASNPVANPSSDDFEPDGTFYSLISLGDRLFTTEPNHGK